MAKKKGNKGKKIQAKLNPSLVSEKDEMPAPDVPDNLPYKIEFMSSTVASMTSIPKPVFTKLCRLCESKDGPFLNIFDSQKVLAKKINRVLPIVIDEYDKLPHKICFRCSAKVEELHEFVEKCIKTQENLKKMTGESKAAMARKIWEEKLKESKMSNDDYCESLIKKAMEQIGTVPQYEPEEANKPIIENCLESNSQASRPKSSLTEKSSLVEKSSLADKSSLAEKSSPVGNTRTTTMKVKSLEELLPKEEPEKNRRSLERKATQEVKVEEERGKLYPVRSTRTRVDMREISPDDVQIRTKDLAVKPPLNKNSILGMVIKEKDVKIERKNKSTNNIQSDNDSIDVEILDEEPKHGNIKTSNVQPHEVINVTPEKDKKHVKNKEEQKCTQEFDIMQHVCTIKVGGAGLLYQCKLCKRNFLKKDVVLTHSCAKQKKDISQPSTSKIDTKGDKSDQRSGDKDIIEAFKQKTAQFISKQSFSMDTEPAQPVPQPRSKPGPASKKKLYSSESSKQSSSQQNPIPPPASTTVKVPDIFPGNASRYKLKPGPNNSFILEADSEQPEENVERVTPVDSKKNKTKAKPSSKHKPEVINLDDDDRNCTPDPNKGQNIAVINKNYPNLSSANEVGKFLGYQSQSGVSSAAPYPVGLFQTIPQESSVQPPNFSTVAMKKTVLLNCTDWKS